MTQVIEVGQYFRVKPGITFKNTGWHHDNHYDRAIFKIDKIDKNIHGTIHATCNICFKPNKIMKKRFDLYFQTTSIMIIKQTPVKLDI